MHISDISLMNIREYENNPRLNDAAVDAVAESIKHYGFLQPIVLDHTLVIVAGHTRYKAAIKLGLETLPCLVLEDGELTPDEIRAYRLADNKTSDLSVWDNKKLLSELDGLEDLFTGFRESSIFDYPGFVTDLTCEDLDGALEQNETGVEYVFRASSADQLKINALAEAWEAIVAEEQ